MTDSPIFAALLLGLTCAGCGQPTRQAAAEEQVTRSIDELAQSRRAFAEAHLERALRLDPSSARAAALLALVRAPDQRDLLLEFYDVGDLVRPPDTVFTEVAGREDRRLPLDDLVELVAADERGSVEHSAGILIVRKSLAGHEKVIALLGALRRSAGVMTTVESRFIDEADPQPGWPQPDWQVIR